MAQEIIHIVDEAKIDLSPTNQLSEEACKTMLSKIKSEAAKLN